MARHSIQSRMLLLGAAIVFLGAGAAPFLLDLEGRRIDLDAPTNGDPVVLHFWATWCPSCRDDLRAFQQARAACSDSHIRVYAINVGESTAAIDEFLKAHELDREVVRDPDSEVWRSQRVRGLPATVVWSASERKVELGPKRTEQWLEVFRSLGCVSPPPLSAERGSDPTASE
jgi:thiol-disulfide isomerase/thioredoxin